MPEGTKQFLDLEGLRLYDTKIKEIIANSRTQADWNENDSSSLSYIKNKTHWIEHTLDQSSVVNFYLIKEAEDQIVLADRDDDQKQTTYAEMVGDDYGAFLTYEVGNPSRGKTDPQMENTVVSVTVAGTTYTATPNFIGTQQPIDPEDDPSRYYTVGNYNLFYSRCNTNPEVSDTPDGPASITDASQANWPFCIWFITERPARYPAYITIIGFETGTSGYTILGDDEYTIPVTITNVNSTYHPLDAHYIPVAQAITDGATGYVTGDQVYDYVQANKGDVNVIETVKVNGSALTPDANKAVDITVPSAPVQDVRVSTDGSAYTSVMSGTNADIDLSGYATVSSLATVATSGSYEDLEDKPFGDELVEFGTFFDTATLNPENESTATSSYSGGELLEEGLSEEQGVWGPTQATSHYEYAWVVQPIEFPEGCESPSDLIGYNVKLTCNGTEYSLPIREDSWHEYSVGQDPCGFGPDPESHWTHPFRVAFRDALYDPGYCAMLQMREGETLDISDVTLFKGELTQIDPKFIPTASSIADGATGYATGDQVYDYVEANKGDTNTIEVVKFKGNGDASASALTIDSSGKSVTIDVSSYALASQIPTVAAAITDSDTGYTTGAQVYAAIAGLAGAMHFKGVIAGAESLPNAPEVGDVYIASAAFNFGQEAVEAGDMFVYSNTGWKIIQGNISMAAIQQMIADATPAVITEDDLDVLLDIFTIEFAKWTHTDDQTGETETGHYSSADGGQGRSDDQLSYDFLLKKTMGSQVSYILIRNWNEETPGDTSVHANYVTVTFDDGNHSFTVTETGEAIPDVSVSPSLYGGLADTDGAFIVTIEGQTLTASDITITTSK